ncbi:uncharacterized protein [Rutidosis leptorrhynchoides]|uniref:uncharacterized protein n=1 Tax=Rutidosis leptorrhynchoides TaxID=125765 RepID=UPI003A9991ED
MQVLSSLTAAKLPPSSATDLNPFVPKKVGIFIWRAKKNRLPVRVELDRKGIDLHSTRCPVCDDDIETLHHSLISCKFASIIWDKVRRWWKFDQLHISSLSDIASCSNPKLNTTLGVSIWQAVVWVTSYYLWIHRNNCTFGKNFDSAAKLFSNIQGKCFEWINCRWRKGALDWLSWITNPCRFDSIFTKDGIG